MKKLRQWAGLIAVILWAAVSLLFAFTLGVGVGFQVGYEEAWEDSSMSFYEEEKAPKGVLSPIIAERLDGNSLNGSRAVFLNVFKSSE